MKKVFMLLIGSYVVGAYSTLNEAKRERNELLKEITKTGCDCCRKISVKIRQKIIKGDNK